MKNVLVTLLYGGAIVSLTYGLTAESGQTTMTALGQVKSAGLFVIFAFLFLLVSIPLSGTTKGSAITFLGFATHSLMTGVVAYLGYAFTLTPEFQLGSCVVYCLVIIAINELSPSQNTKNINP